MLLSVSFYSFKDANGVKDDYITTDFAKATVYARKHSLKIIEEYYETPLTNVIEDYTGDYPTENSFVEERHDQS